MASLDWSRPYWHWLRKTGVGGNLVLYVKDYKPNVLCMPQHVTDNRGAYRNLLDHMNFSPQWTRFVRGAGIPPGGLKEYDCMWDSCNICPLTCMTHPVLCYSANSCSTATGSCVATIDIRDGVIQEKAKWGDFWAAAVAIERMCVRHGKTGIAVGIGTYT